MIATPEITGASPVPVRVPPRNYTRAQITAAVSAAGNHPKATDADMRRLVTLQFHMITHRLETIDTETLGDEQMGKLLEFFVPRG